MLICNFKTACYGNDCLDINHVLNGDFTQPKARKERFLVSNEIDARLYRCGGLTDCLARTIMVFKS